MRSPAGRTVLVLIGILLVANLAAAQAAPAANPEDTSARFSRALGVPLDKVTLHFYLVKNGGVVELSAKDTADAATIAALQKYLQSQKDLWEKGKETAVTDVHMRAPESAATMRKLRNEITFYMAKTDNGGVLRMFSINEQARAAIQDYLRFEIGEHKTGDATTLEQ